MTRVNIAGAGVIPAAVALEPSAPADASEILAGLPADLRSSVDLTISKESLGEDTSSFGGMDVTKNGSRYATSGYSVTNTSTGVKGVTTAGHAEGANGIIHPGEASYTFIFQSEHRGAWGDIEWHTTNTSELDDFCATSTLIYEVTNVEARAGISVGESVCQYGRWSNDRDCSLDVYDVSSACTLSGVFNNRLVQMNAITSVVGDSGGGWSWGGFA